MENPFKFGTVVDGDYFTDRTQELVYVKQVLDSRNHLVLISPRRFGKTSLVLKAAKETARPVLFLNFETVTDTRDLAAALLKRLFKLYPMERLRHLMRSFRFVPTISMSAVGDSVDVSFMPRIDENVVLEDAFALMEKVSDERRLIVVFDEFQEVNAIESKLDRTLRAILQMQHNINYVLLGSQEGMMREIFEHKHSPFYHFGTVMTIGRIPAADFADFIETRLDSFGGVDVRTIAENIIRFTSCHPYYTQKLAFHVWNLLNQGERTGNVVENAVRLSNIIHDIDYERLWQSFNKTDKKILKWMAHNASSPLTSVETGMPASTVFSALKRMMRSGFIVKGERYGIEDPFFARWIQDKM